MKELFLLTTNFPSGKPGEIWLDNEVKIIHGYFKAIKIFPEHDNYTPIQLPKNCIAIQNAISSSLKLRLGLMDYLKIVKIVFSDFIISTKQGVFLKNLRYNISLIKLLYRRALFLLSSMQHPENTIIYSYWADNAATMGSIIKMIDSRVRVYTRAHGYEIYEDLKKDGMIPFRHFQNKYVDRFFSVSKRGMQHLASKYPQFHHKYSSSYLGTNDNGLAPFDKDQDLTIVTCCNLNRIKRIHLVPDILANLSINCVWHVIGDGPEMNQIKELNKNLPKNIEVVYHGHLTQEEVNKFYQTHSINLLLSVSYSEGLPVSMMEAISYGIPIIASDVGGCNEVCNSRTGKLFPRDFESKAVAKILNEFKSSNMNLTEFRIECRNYWMENFNANKNYRKFADLINT